MLVAGVGEGLWDDNDPARCASCNRVSEANLKKLPTRRFPRPGRRGGGSGPPSPGTGVDVLDRDGVLGLAAERTLGDDASLAAFSTTLTAAEGVVQAQAHAGNSPPAPRSDPRVHIGARPPAAGTSGVERRGAGTIAWKTPAGT